MRRMAVLGEPAVIRGWGLAGLLVVAASDDEQARAAWPGLPPDVGLVILTAAAAKALRAEIDAGDRLVAVLP